MKARKTVCAVLLAALFLPLLAVTAPAQATVGTIYLNATTVRTTAGTTCAEVQPSYGASTEAPTGTTAAKAFLAEATYALSCSTFFEYIMPADTVVSGTAVVDLWLGCELPTLMRPLPAGLLGRQVTLLKGSTSIGTLGQFSSEALCSPGTLIRWTSNVAVTETPFASGDRFVLQLLIWALNPSPAMDDLFISTGSTAAPSSVTMSGLGASEPELESFVLSASEATAETAPGGSASYALNLTNSGGSFADFEFSATDLPNGTETYFEPASGRAEAGSSHEVTLTVNVSASAVPGSYEFVVQVLGPAGGNASLPLTLIVTDAGTPPSSNPTDAPTDSPGDPSVSPTGNTSEGAGNESSGPKDGGESGGIPSPAAWMTVTALSALVVLVRRRR